jgi:integrase
MARRGAGEGSIYRDKTDGGWRATVELGIGEDGQRERKYLRGRTRADVAQKVRDVLKDVDEGLPVSRDGDGPTVEQWLNHWHSTIQKKRLRESSYLAEGLTLQNHVIPVLGKVRLKMLQPEQVERLYARLDEKGLSPSTVLKAHRHLNRALKVAMQRGLVSRNVCSLVDAPSVTHTEVVPLTQEEARRLLDVAMARRNGARWSVALGLGLRQGEALGLAWPNVDLEAGTIRVSQALGKAHWEHGCSEDSRKPSCEAKRGFLCPERNGHGLRLALPKSRAGKRTVPLPAPVVEQLRAHRKAQLEERIAAGSEWWEEQKAEPGYSWDLVFRTPAGRPVAHHPDWCEWKSLLKEADVRDARLHDARHTAASLLLVMGVPARVVMEVLGHSQIGLTLNTYSHVMPEVQRAAADAMGGALWGEVPPATPRNRRRETS